VSQGVMEPNEQASAERTLRPPQYPQEPKRSGLFLGLVLVAIVLVIAGVFTLLHRRSQYRALASETETLAVPTVSVVHPIAASDSEDLVLPSTLQAYVESPIYARTSGYLKKWYHDIGTRVRKGELLADIDAPEIDHRGIKACCNRTVSRSRKLTMPPVTSPPSAPIPSPRKPTSADCRKPRDSNMFMHRSVA
jgi:hypothetical protein